MINRSRGASRTALANRAPTGPETLERRACPAVVSVSAPAEVDETAGQTDMLITLSQPVAASTSVQYTFRNGSGSAIFGRDYAVSLDGRQLGSAGTLTFRPGQTSLTLRVNVVNDGLVETVEAFTLTLFSPRGLTLGARQATVEINDSGAGTPGTPGGGSGGGGPVSPPNPSLPTLQITAPATVAEAGGRSTVQVTLSQPSARPVSVGYAITPLQTSELSRATYGADYMLTLGGRRLPAVGTLNFRPGQTSLSLDLMVTNDRAREGDEAFTVSLQRPSGAALDPVAQAAPVTIDDDDDYTVSIFGSSPIAAGQPYDFLVELSSPATQREIFYATTIDGTATAGRDYHPLFRAPVVIQPGQTTGRLRVVTVADDPANREYDETFAIQLQPLSPGFPAPTPDFPVMISGPLGPRPPEISIADTTVDEGEAPFTTEAVFTVTLAAPWTTAVTVSYATVDGTATVADGDFGETFGTLTFAPGETVQEVRVPVIGDDRQERNETFTVTLSSPVNTIIARPTATGTIVNDDAPAYQIVVVFIDDTLTPAQQAVFQNAAARWSEIIVADVPDVVYQGRTIDDLEIVASAPFIDGAGGILGQAGPDEVRMDDTFLPYLGTMQFDSADVARMVADGSFEDVILHEMGHVIGIGTLWNVLEVVRGLGTANPTFVGTNAVREYQTLSGTQATSVPVENTGGAGTAGSHWRESVFGAELMTGFLNPGVNPISRLTIGSLQDIGYTVDYAAADPYTLNLRHAAANFRQLQLPRNRAARRFMMVAAENSFPSLVAAAASAGTEDRGQADAPQAKSRVFRSIASRLV